ncbi:hypothetical protein RRG08_046379 [Elysia crispata]|uniref:Uncharacterized protein n=1 Tax=Elysia crispata TaxID=231223 RepID=A0AAE1E5V2_9GAST|nr:hypothetical protein RRG08_046379 [Elysia crispata]
MVPSSLWFQAVYGSKQSMVPSSLWFQAVYGSKQSLVPSSLWFQAVYGSKQSLVPSSLWFQAVYGISICCEVSGHVATLPGAKVVPASNLKPSTGCLVHALGRNEVRAGASYTTTAPLVTASSTTAMVADSSSKKRIENW